MKQAVIAVVLILAGSVIAHMHVVSQMYYPVVRIAAPEGLTYTAVQDATPERRACGQANDRFLAPIKQGCKQCQVVYARCERKLEGMALAIDEGKALAHFQVFAPGLRMAIDGPEEPARASCDFIAGDMVGRGVHSAACVNPRPAPVRS
jgi:hypothetical protein